MALQRTHDELGTTYATAYHRIVGLNWNKVLNNMNVQVTTYTDDTLAYPCCKVNYDFTYDPTGVEALTQAYTYLKTLPEFSGAVDV